jgi:putative transposase
MPHGPRLDAPGVLHHVMARGIQRRAIFRNDQDRDDFVDRLAGLVQDTALSVYAWALIPDHFHLVVRTDRRPLSRSMRSLLTGYAVAFNRRHGRSGHLFQNRYTSRSSVRKTLISSNWCVICTSIRCEQRTEVGTDVGAP